MVAYSFQKRFVEPIRAGAKRQTIRADRKRHARAGEAVQLYCGMRTKDCFKILDPDPICYRVADIRIDVRRNGIAMIAINGVPVPTDFDRFARADGFADIDDMHMFWLRAHGLGTMTGKLIQWRCDVQ